MISVFLPGINMVSKMENIFMACEVLFGLNSGREGGVSHYRFVKPID
jgi:hypothetical protein